MKTKLDLIFTKIKTEAKAMLKYRKMILKIHWRMNTKTLANKIISLSINMEKIRI
jgi:hypothetical protein